MKIPPVKVIFLEEDKKEILGRIEECLTTGILAQGKNVREFEEKFAKYVGVKHAVAVSSGGAAIEIAMRILNVKGKEVIVPTNTFLATASSVVLAGGKVKLVDIDPDTFCISLESLRRAVTKQTVGVIIVHVGGIITHKIEEIKKWCDDNNLWLFEDCAHAHGSRFNGKMAGTFGIAGAYSFFATKVMTSGEGGMIVTNDNNFAKKARILRDYGKTEPWISYYTELGANWRMSDITAAIGVVQFKRLNDFIAWREKIANIYTKSLKSDSRLKLVLPKGKCSWYKYIVLLPKDIDRDEIKKRMKEKDVSLSGGVYDIPLHRQPIFSSLKERYQFPVADDVCKRHICLPIYYGMKEEEAMYVIETLQWALGTKR